MLLVVCSPAWLNRHELLKNVIILIHVLAYTNWAAVIRLPNSSLEASADALSVPA